MFMAIDCIDFKLTLGLKGLVKFLTSILRLVALVAEECIPGSGMSTDMSVVMARCTGWVSEICPEFLKKMGCGCSKSCTLTDPGSLLMSY